jgi:hypothetical protein
MISTVTSLINREVASHALPRIGADRWLSLAAAPTFAIMALLTEIHGGAMPNMLCSAAQNASPLTGMAPMYLLMSAFHLAPWLRLFSRLVAR